MACKRPEPDLLEVRVATLGDHDDLIRAHDVVQVLQHRLVHGVVEVDHRLAEGKAIAACKAADHRPLVADQVFIHAFDSLPAALGHHDGALLPLI